MKRPAIFLDRDGVLNAKPAEHEYVRSPAEFHWLAGAAEGAAHLARAGYVLAVVSNQRGLARGLVAPQTLAEIEALIQDELSARGVRIEAFRYCPHDLDAGCGCRKPEPGMILALGRELALDLPRSWMVGDSASDVEAGRAAGTRTLLVADGPPSGHVTPDLLAPSLLMASELILELAGGGARTVGPLPGRVRDPG